LTDLNDISTLGNDLFSMKLNYNSSNNINHQSWKTPSTPNQIQSFTYNYDNLNRITQATFNVGGNYNETFNYDKNGNIKTLLRKGQILTATTSKSIVNPPITTAKTYGLVDNLSYYYEGNQLFAVTDAVNSINTELNNDFRTELKSGGSPGIQYSYDANGNMTTDCNKGITITYNMLNQPATIEKSAGNKTVYLYDAAGRKLRTQIYEDSKLKTTIDYCGAFEYENNRIKYIHTPEGRITYTISSDDSKATLVVSYEYDLKDQLGNVRVVFTKNKTTGVAQKLQETHYYAFGLQMNGLGIQGSNKYLYNGKEKQEQTGMYDYGFRQMDPALGRWFCVDAMAESYVSMSPYVYGLDNPVNVVDLMGLTPAFMNQRDYGIDIIRNYFSGGGEEGATRGSGGGGRDFAYDVYQGMDENGQAIWGRETSMRPGINYGGPLSTSNLYFSISGSYLGYSIRGDCEVRVMNNNVLPDGFWEDKDAKIVNRQIADANSLLFSEAYNNGMSDAAVKKIFKFFGKMAGANCNIDFNENMHENTLMRYTKGPNTSKISVKLSNWFKPDFNTKRVFADNYYNILSSFSHELQHLKDAKINRFTETNDKENSACFAQTQSKYWKNTSGEFKVSTIMYWETFSGVGFNSTKINYSSQENSYFYFALIKYNNKPHVFSLFYYNK